MARSVEEGDLLTCRQLDWKKISESGNEASGKTLLSVNEHKPENAAYYNIIDLQSLMTDFMIRFNFLLFALKVCLKKKILLVSFPVVGCF